MKDLHELNAIVRETPEKVDKEELELLISMVTESLAAMLANSSKKLEMSDEDRKIFDEAAQTALSINKRVSETKFFS